MKYGKRDTVRRFPCYIGVTLSMEQFEWLQKYCLDTEQTFGKAIRKMLDYYRENISE